MKTEEQKILRKKWVEALRSGEYNQCRGSLKDGTGYCCLGVACEVFGMVPDYKNGMFRYWGNASWLPPIVKEAFGLNTCFGDFNDKTQSLTVLNDNGKSFAEIADIIESEPEGLFLS